MKTAARLIAVIAFVLAAPPIVVSQQPTAPSPRRGSNLSHAELRDFTELCFSQVMDGTREVTLTLAPVAPIPDTDTGFVVGGINATATIEGLTQSREGHGEERLTVDDAMQAE